MALSACIGLFERYLSKTEMVYMLGLIDRCHSCPDEPGLIRLAGDLKELVPFERFASLMAAVDGRSYGYAVKVVGSGYPREWVEEYVENRYHEVDPVLIENFRSYKLQFWEDTYARRSAPGWFRARAEEHGLTAGFTHGALRPCGKRGSLFSFAGGRLRKDGRSVAVLELMTPHLHTALERVSCVHGAQRRAELTPRELEVLKWVSAGKTTWSISVILGISERTVKFHVDNVMKKLDATSRTHAAAIASSLGLVEMD